MIVRFLIISILTILVVNKSLAIEGIILWAPSSTRMSKEFRRVPVTVDYFYHFRKIGFNGIALRAMVGYNSHKICKSIALPDKPLVNYMMINKKYNIPWAKKAGFKFIFLYYAFFNYHKPCGLRWDDDKSWYEEAVHLSLLAKFAKELQLTGIAIDLEEYAEGPLFYSDLRYQNKKLIKKIAEKRGKQLIKAIINEYPDIVILFYPNYLSQYKKRPLWHHFFKGFTSVKFPGEIHLADQKFYWLFTKKNPKRAILKQWQETNMLLRKWGSNNIYIAPGCELINEYYKNRLYNTDRRRLEEYLKALSKLKNIKFIWIDGYFDNLWLYPKNQVDKLKIELLGKYLKTEEKLQ